MTKIILIVLAIIKSVKAEQLPLDVKQPYQIKQEQVRLEKDKSIVRSKKFDSNQNNNCVIKTVMTNDDIQACRT